MLQLRRGGAGKDFHTFYSDSLACHRVVTRFYALRAFILSAHSLNTHSAHQSASWGHSAPDTSILLHFLYLFITGKTVKQRLYVLSRTQKTPPHSPSHDYMATKAERYSNEANHCWKSPCSQRRFSYPSVKVDITFCIIGISLVLYTSFISFYVSLPMYTMIKM